MLTPNHGLRGELASSNQPQAYFFKIGFFKKWSAAPSSATILRSAPTPRWFRIRQCIDQRCCTRCIRRCASRSRVSLVRLAQDAPPRRILCRVRARVLDPDIMMGQFASCGRLFRRQPIFHLRGNAKLSGFCDGFTSHRSGRQLFCLCQSLGCPGSPIVTIRIVARRFGHVIVLNLVLSSRCSSSRWHRTSSARC